MDPKLDVNIFFAEDFGFVVVGDVLPFYISLF